MSFKYVCYLFWNSNTEYINFSERENDGIKKTRR